jgi:CBS domain-containing protein
MTPDPIALQSEQVVAEAARVMSESNVGAVVVRKGERLYGIVTDRDIVVRVLAEGRNPQETRLGAICSAELLTVSPDQTVAEAIQLMRSRAVRRLPVVAKDDVVGIVSLADLALSMDRTSPLGAIRAAPPNH